MRGVWEILYARQLPLHYVSPGICGDFSGSSSPIIVLSQPALNKIFGLILGGFGNFRLSWNAFPGAICYNVYRVVGVDLYEIQAQCIPDPFYDLTEDGTYVVTAITLEGETPFSDPVDFVGGGGGGTSTVSVEAVCKMTGRNTFPATFMISRDSITPVNLTVNFSLTGTAANGTDYDAVPLSAIIPAGSDFVMVDIAPIEAEFTVEKTVVLTISPSGTYAVGAPASAMVVIKPTLLRIADYGASQPLLVPAPAGNVPEAPRPSDGCEWDGSFNLLQENAPVPGPQFVYRYQDSNGNWGLFDLAESIQGATAINITLAGPFNVGVRWQVAIVGRLDDGNTYTIWQGFKNPAPGSPEDVPEGTYAIAGATFSDLRPTLEFELV